MMRAGPQVTGPTSDQDRKAADPGGSGRSGPTRSRCSCGGIPGPSGECAACRRKRKLGLQTKLRVGPPGNRWEREADRVARTVVDGGGAMPATLSAAPSVQRLSPGGPVEGDRTEAPPETRRVLAAPGRPLDRTTRQAMEGGFGRDFRQVRIHTGALAADAARALHARAFTVGDHIAFGAGEYRPETRDGQRLLAHELTHTVQQSGGGAPSTVQRDPLPSPDPDPPAAAATPAQKAREAEASCDMKAICDLWITNPTVMPNRRVVRAARTCRPGVIWLGSSPCLEPGITSPGFFPPLTLNPRSASATGAGAVGPVPTQPPASSGLPDFGELLTFEYKTGEHTFTLKLPSSAKAKLPVELTKGYKLTFSLEAKTSGAFTFSITLDGVPHVQFSASTTVDVAGKSVKSELKVSSAAKTCHAKSPQASKEALTKAGKKLEKAILDINKSDAQLDAEKDAAKTGAAVTASSPEGFDRVKRLGDVVSGILDVKKAIDDAQKGCEPTPVVSFGIGSQVPFDPRAEDAVPSMITGGLIINF